MTLPHLFMFPTDGEVHRISGWMGDPDRSVTFGVFRDDFAASIREAVEEANARGLTVGEGSIQMAMRLGRALLGLIDAPDVVIDGDGEVLFEWVRGHNRMFSISVSNQGRLHYAGLYGNNTKHGSEYFGAEVPDEILAGLRRFRS